MTEVSVWGTNGRDGKSKWVFEGLVARQRQCAVAPGIWQSGKACKQSIAFPLETGESMFLEAQGHHKLRMCLNPCVHVSQVNWDTQNSESDFSFQPSQKIYPSTLHFAFHSSLNISINYSVEQ